MMTIVFVVAATQVVVVVVHEHISVLLAFLYV